MLEKTVEKKLVEGVKKMGGISYKFTSPGNYGVPDRLCIYPGGLIDFVEVKTEKGKLTDIQKVQIDKIKSRGANVIVVYGLDDVIRYLHDTSFRLDNKALIGEGD